MSKTSVQPIITILVDLRNMTGRVNLEGVFKVANRRGWNLRVLSDPRELTPELVRQMDATKNTGFILADTITNPETIESLKGTHFPIVSIGRRFVSLRHRPDAAYISFDESRIGAYGAEFMLSFGNFAAYGFVNHSDKCAWSVKRGYGFTERLASHGITASTFQATCEEDFVRLPDWLKALPKPAAVLASWDDCALKVITAARLAHIQIPADMILLGADDDPLLCENSRPRLSSIKLDNLYNGQWAADMIDRLCSGKKVKCAVNKICGVMERESTRHISPSQRIVRAGIAYIEEHACEGISVKDVIQQLGISESLANRRFRESGRASIGQAIIDVKLAKVTRLLQTSNWPISRIAHACGFSNPNRLSHLFKERYQLSMKEFRRKG